MRVVFPVSILPEMAMCLRADSRFQFRQFDQPKVKIRSTNSSQNADLRNHEKATGCFVSMGPGLISCGPDVEECAFVPDTAAIHVNRKWTPFRFPSCHPDEARTCALLGVHPEIRDVFLNRDK